jgi:hypothetical protein
MFKFTACLAVLLSVTLSQPRLAHAGGCQHKITDEYSRLQRNAPERYFAQGLGCTLAIAAAITAGVLIFKRVSPGRAPEVRDELYVGMFLASVVGSVAGCVGGTYAGKYLANAASLPWDTSAEVLRKNRLVVLEATTHLIAESQSYQAGRPAGPHLQILTASRNPNYSKLNSFDQAKLLRDNAEEILRDESNGTICTRLELY